MKRPFLTVLEGSKWSCHSVSRICKDARVGRCLMKPESTSRSYVDPRQDEVVDLTIYSIQKSSKPAVNGTLDHAPASLGTAAKAYQDLPPDSLLFHPDFDPLSASDCVDRASHKGRNLVFFSRVQLVFVLDVSASRYYPKTWPPFIMISISRFSTGTMHRSNAKNPAAILSRTSLASSTTICSRACTCSTDRGGV